jgi:hypothetical protein
VLGEDGSAQRRLGQDYTQVLQFFLGRSLAVDLKPCTAILPFTIIRNQGAAKRKWKYSPRNCRLYEDLLPTRKVRIA